MLAKKPRKGVALLSRRSSSQEVKILDHTGRPFNFKPERKHLVNSRGEPIPGIVIPSAMLVRALTEVHSKKMLDVHDKVLNEAHRAFVELMRMRNYQTSDAILLLSKTRLFRRNMKVVKDGTELKLVTKQGLQDVGRMGANEIRNIYADWIIDEYLATKRKKQALWAVLQKHTEKLASATRKSKTRPIITK